MATKQQTYQDRIVSIPGVVGGKPVVKGTRIPVELVLKYLAAEPDINVLFEAFPHLTREDVQICLSFAQEVIAENELLCEVSHLDFRLFILLMVDDHLRRTR